MKELPPSRLIWATPNGDQLIGHMARVSNPKAQESDPAERLISYLLRNHHWSPFQMANMAVEVHTTRDISAQIIRHQSIAFQEFSTRYADVEELLDNAECRFQDDKNRQNSFDATEDQDDVVDWWNRMVADTAADGESRYKAAREQGIAKEVARRILPIGLIPTKLYMQGSVRSWLHYIGERTKPGVQKEHRVVAQACEHLFAQAFPLVYEASLHMRLEQKTQERRAKQMEIIEQVIRERGAAAATGAMITLSLRGDDVVYLQDPDREVWEALA